MVNSSEWQQFQRHAREGVAAILRKDTGAAVTPHEWDWYYPMYYPQPGDDADVVRDKQQARLAVANGLRGASGPAFDRMFPKFNEQLRERLLAKGANLTPFEPQQQKASDDKPVRVSTPDEARKLAPGTKILLPDGSLGIVPGMAAQVEQPLPQRGKLRNTTPYVPEGN
jgi:hypothetical protein